MLKTTEAPVASSPPGKQVIKTSHTGLRSPELLGRRPAIGLVMIIFGGILFGIIAVNLQTPGPLIQFDMQISNSLHIFALQSSPFIKDIMIFGYYMGEHVIIGIGLVLLVYFLYKRAWPEASMVLIAWLGEGSLWVITTGYFHRARPVFDVPVWHLLTSNGFPSGHSISAVMCYGLVAYLLVPRISSRFWKIVVIVAAGVIIIYIAFSRVYVGDHYPTDVLAGLGLGIAWSGLVYTSVEVISIRIKRRREQSGQASTTVHTA